MDSINDLEILQQRARRGEKIIKARDELKKAQEMLTTREPETSLHISIVNSDVHFSQNYYTTVVAKNQTQIEKALLDGIRSAIAKEIERLNQEFKDL